MIYGIISIDVVRLFRCACKFMAKLKNKIKNDNDMRKKFKNLFLLLYLIFNKYSTLQKKNFVFNLST